MVKARETSPEAAGSPAARSAGAATATTIRTTMRWVRMSASEVDRFVDDEIDGGGIVPGAVEAVDPRRSGPDLLQRRQVGGRPGARPGGRRRHAGSLGARRLRAGSARDERALVRRR